MKRLTKLFICFAVLTSHVFGQINSSISNLKIKELGKSYYNFKVDDKTSGTVFIFLFTDCPASQNYTLLINDLVKKYQKNTINFAIVFPGDFSSENEIQSFVKTYHLTTPILIDQSFKLTKFLNATVAPESFVLNKYNKIIYSGRIDDQYFSPGRKRQVITSHDLDAAISNLVSGKIQLVQTTKAIGCIINY